MSHTCGRFQLLLCRNSFHKTYHGCCLFGAESGAQHNLRKDSESFALSNEPKITVIIDCVPFDYHYCLFSCSVVSDSFATPWTAACQAPLPMGFPSQEHWSGLPFPSPGDLPDLGIEPVSPALAGGEAWSIFCICSWHWLAQPIEGLQWICTPGGPYICCLQSPLWYDV